MIFELEAESLDRKHIQNSNACASRGLYGPLPRSLKGAESSPSGYWGDVVIIHPAEHVLTTYPAAAVPPLFSFIPSEYQEPRSSVLHTTTTTQHHNVSDGIRYLCTMMLAARPGPS